MNWVDSKVGDFCPFVYGKAIKKENQLDSGFPVYGSNGVYAYSAQPLVAPYAVVIGRKGSVGKLHLSQQPCWVSDTAFYVPFDSLNEAFFAYYLLSTLGLEKMNTDAAVPGLNRDNAHRLEIKVPDQAEGRASVIRTLKILDDKIQLNRQTNQTLEAIAQAIFKSWFVDFDPTRAKIAANECAQARTAGASTEELIAQLLEDGRWTKHQAQTIAQGDPELAAMSAISGQFISAAAPKEPEANEPYPQLTPENDVQGSTNVAGAGSARATLEELRQTAALFPSALVDSELGEIPEGWEVVGFKDIVKKYIDNRGKTPPIVESGIPLLEVKHLPEDSIKPNLNTSKFVDFETYESWFRAHLKADDIMISTVGTIGRICLVPKGEKIAIAQNLLGMRFNSERVLPYFMYYQMDGFRFRHDVNARLVITVQASIKRKDLETIALMAPPIDLQSKFETSIAPFVAMQQGGEENILEQLRDSLLPKLLSGELEIRE